MSQGYGDPSVNVVILVLIRLGLTRVTVGSCWARTPFLDEGDSSLLEESGCLLGEKESDEDVVLTGRPLDE